MHAVGILGQRQQADWEHREALVGCVENRAGFCRQRQSKGPSDRWRRIEGPFIQKCRACRKRQRHQVCEAGPRREEALTAGNVGGQRQAWKAACPHSPKLLVKGQKRLTLNPKYSRAAPSVPFLKPGVPSCPPLYKAEPQDPPCVANLSSSPCSCLCPILICSVGQGLC